MARLRVFRGWGKERRMEREEIDGKGKRLVEKGRRILPEKPYEWRCSGRKFILRTKLYITYKLADERVLKLLM